jgi:alpha-beta hydrolase superfamily lysophospholipase
MNPFYRFTLWSSAHIAPKRTLTGRRLNRRPSDNIEHLRKLSRDPLMIKHTRIESIYGLVTLMDKAQDQATNLKIPVLLLYGHNDEIIPRQPVEHLATQLPQPKEVVAYEAGYHMLLRDQQREVVFEDISDWVFSVFP